MNKIFKWAPEILREVGYRYDLDFVNHLTLIVCFVSYMQWVKREKFPLKAHSPYWNTLTCLNNCSKRSPKTWRYTLYDRDLRENLYIKACGYDIIHDGILSAAHNLYHKLLKLARLTSPTIPQNLQRYLEEIWGFRDFASAGREKWKSCLFLSLRCRFR